MMKALCKGCGRDFPYQAGKQFHNVPCRKAYYHSEKLTSDQQLWDGAEEYNYPEAMRQVEPEVRLKLILEALQEQGVAFFRVGSRHNVPDKAGMIRWFPTERHVRTFLAITPFDYPKDVPYSGLYLVALFDKAKRLIDQPSWKIPLRDFSPRIRWSSGSLLP